MRLPRSWSGRAGLVSLVGGFVLWQATGAAAAAAAAADPPVPTRAPLWTFATHGALWGGLTVQDGVLYVGSDDRRLYAVDVRTHRTRWTFATGGAVRTKPLVTGDRVVVASDDGYLHAIDRRTGRALWRVSLRSEGVTRRPPSADTPFYDYEASSPVESDGTIYVGSAAGHVFAVRASDGVVAWTRDTGDTVRASPRVADGRVYVGSWDHRVYALDARTGEVAWTFDTEGIVQSTPALAGGRLVVGSRSSKLFALDAATGHVAWSRPFDEGSWVESSGTVADGVVYLGSSDAFHLYALDPATGAARWSYATGGWTWGTPVVADGTVYIGSLSASPYYQPGVRLHAGFHAVDAATGQPRWRFVPPAARGYVDGGVFGAAAIAEGRVYVPGVDGTVYVFGT